MRSMIWAIALLWGTAVQAIPVGQPLEFEQPEQRELYQEMLHELRCTVCQNQSLAESNAGLAQDLRKQLYGMVTDGADRQQITDFMVERYGEFVLYRPRLQPSTYLLWFGPFALLLLGAVVLRLNLRSRARVSETRELSDEERQVLARYLDSDKEK